MNYVLTSTIIITTHRNSATSADIRILLLVATVDLSCSSPLLTHTHTYRGWLCTLFQNVYKNTTSKSRVRAHFVCAFALLRRESRQNVRVNFRASKHFFVLVRKPVTGRQVKHKASSCPTPWLRGMGGAGEGSTRDYILCVKRKGEGTDELIHGKISLNGV